MRGTKPWEIRNERARLAWLARGRRARPGPLNLVKIDDTMPLLTMDEWRDLLTR